MVSRPNYTGVRQYRQAIALRLDILPAASANTSKVVLTINVHRACHARLLYVARNRHTQARRFQARYERLPHPRRVRFPVHVTDVGIVAETFFVKQARRPSCHPRRAPRGNSPPVRL